MAKPSSVWGIDIGQCALRALCCRADGDEIVAEAFDYVEYPKILSQPEADPEALIKEALEQFLSRNDIRRSQVAISVPGQSGLAKFFKPPPVDVKRIPDIVRYEARQQIPFPLEEVVWDFQKMAGGQEVDGFAVDSEVGLFAMKRDQVQRALQPLQDQDIEVDTIQLAPLAIYNFTAYDMLTDLPDPELYDADDPPESVVVISIGTDATDLVVTNGFRVWQRSIPLGGNHFTKQLTKELKLTFAKAEHLKRNAREAEDPKSVFQAMRPIFNDLVTEIQRSIGYFQGIDRNAKIKGVVLLGNTVKLPGLQSYVAKNLGYEVISFDKFRRLSGSSVLSSPAFADNNLSYATCYGLCIQGLDKGPLHTNLLPPEIKTQRMVRAKKPWAIASLSALMLAVALNFVFHYSAWSSVQEEYSSGDKSWADAKTKQEGLGVTSSGHQFQHETAANKLEVLKNIGDEVVGAGDRRLLWLELLKAIDQALPWTPGIHPREYVDFKTKPYGERHELFIEKVESQFFPNLASWYTPTVQRSHDDLVRHLAGDDVDATEEAPPPRTAGPPRDENASTAPEDLQTPGWVIELRGYHYYDEKGSGADHVRNTLLKELETGEVELPVEGKLVTFTMKELGIRYPILAEDTGRRITAMVDNPDYRSGDPITEENPPQFTVRKYSFAVQFCWVEQLLKDRLKKREEAAKNPDQAGDAEEA